jgi:hypothetical protein
MEQPVITIFIVYYVSVEGKKKKKKKKKKVMYSYLYEINN